MVAQRQWIIENTVLYRAFSMNNPCPSDGTLNIGLLNIRSVRNKGEYIVELLNEFH